MTYLKRIKELRLSHDLTQERVAKYLGIKAQTYGRYETGKSFLPVRHLIKLAKLYNVPTDYIAGLTDETIRH